MTARSLVCALAVISVSITGCATTRPQAAGGQDRNVPPLPVGSATSLVYALPASVLDGREHQLDFVVTENQAEMMRESVMFTVAEDSKRPLIEVLPLHPQFLAERRQGRGDGGTRVSIHLDGGLVEERSLAELAARSGELQESDASIVNVRLQPGPTGLAATTPYGCVWNCEQAAATCNRTCLRFPRPNCEDYCDSRLTFCLQACGCPVAIREVRVTTTYVGFTAGPRVCLFDVSGGRPLFDGHYYDRRTEIYKHEHYVDMVQCDGNHAIVLGSVDYTYTRCVKRVMSLPGLCIPNGGQIFNETTCSH